MSAHIIPHPISSSTVVVVDGDRFRVFDLLTKSSITPEFPEVKATVEESEEKGKKKKEKKAKLEGDQEEDENEDGSRALLYVVFSPKGDRLATVDGMKCMCVWDTNTWTCIGTSMATRRPSRMIFSADGETLFVADKAGDVYSFCVADMAQPMKLVLGILTMLMDVVVTSNGKYIITADRDDKARISAYPNTYNIQSFCLGHTNMVTSLCLPEHQSDLLVTGSGDGSIRVWRYMDGSCLSTHKYHANVGEGEEEEIIVNGITYNTITGHLAVSIEGGATVYLHQVDANGQTTAIQSLTFESPVVGCKFGSAGRLWIAMESGKMTAYDWNNTEYASVEADEAMQYLNSNSKFG
eukprot:Ihof_evm15s5 gene=Ihof_evmTU15s5